MTFGAKTTMNESDADSSSSTPARHRQGPPPHGTALRRRRQRHARPHAAVPQRFRHYGELDAVKGFGEQLLDEAAGRAS